MAIMEPMMGGLNDFLKRLDPGAKVALALATVLLLGVLDLSTGHDVSFLVLYLIPIGFSAWYAGRGTGLLIAVFSTVFWVVDNAWGRPWRPYDAWELLEKGAILGALALLIRRVRVLLDHEQALARTDPLTGLVNRRVLFEALEGECRGMERHHEPMTLLYLDLDRFKEVNDRQGHAEGDRLLCAVAGILRGAVRPADLVARIGGDEFVVLLPRTTAPDAERVTARIREDLALAAAAHGWPVTFSAGAATWVKPCGSPDELMRFADALLYVAKTGGRNRAEFRTAGPD